MNRTFAVLSFSDKLLTKMGGFYIFLALFIAQLVAIPLGIFIAAQVMTTNTNLSNSQIGGVALIGGGLLLARNGVLFTYIYISNHSVFKRLDKWSKGIQLDTGTEEEREAWRQITSLAWRYIFLAVGILFIIIIPMVLSYLYFILHGTFDEVIYSMLAMFVTGLSMALIEVLAVESLLTNTRRVLLPSDFESQVTGVTGIRLLPKLVIAFAVLITITILLIAPIGYHQTTVVLYEEIGSQKVLGDLQLQSLIFGLFSLLLGLGISFLLSRSMSQTIRQMVNTFGKVERGDLQQRLPINSTDELGELGVYFNRMVSRLEEFQTGLETQVASRTAQLQTTLEIGRVANSSLSTEELINRVVNLITDRFGYYYAALFLIDGTGRWAELIDATGDAGRTLKSRKHRLEIGGKSMVGTTISTRQARIALDVGAESVRFDNPLLPDTRSEIALPLIIGERVVGALDVQSKEEAAFQEDDINTLQGAANQVAIALENARLFQETQNSLEELRISHRQYITDAWSERTQTQGKYEYLGNQDKTTQGELVSVPLTLRDQIIGQLSLEGDQEWSQEEIVMIEAVATQAALALENARLLDESQQLALRERLTAEIISKVWSSSNIDAILQTAVKELGRALRADEVTIEIKPE